ncbi:proto-oncogene c-Fos-like [Gigantopelta aegis]|uniref:proto-oncogene c-Fos-like n=1 Tax=Gigantopelta aegis TaxID=1735272 RepID=UPI001B88B50B|nr:proto-oncogene c-Fos-like [Gigantopelta aegis]
MDLFEVLENATKTSNLPVNPVHLPDARLMEAAQKSERTNQIMPILKEELRARIMLQRLKRGQPTIKTDADQPIQYELTSEELEKKRRRRQQNREAARRCRSRKRQCRDNLVKKFEEMENRRLILEKEVAELRREKRELESRLRDHMLSRQCHFGHDTHDPSPNINENMPLMVDLEPCMSLAYEESLFEPWQYKPDVDSTCTDIPPFSEHQYADADDLLSGNESAFDLDIGNWEDV